MAAAMESASRLPMTPPLPTSLQNMTPTPQRLPSSASHVLSVTGSPSTGLAASATMTVDVVMIAITLATSVYCIAST